MERKEFSIIDVTKIVSALDGAGHKAGVTSVAKLAGVTRPRASRMLKSAARTGLVYPYGDRFRSNVDRICYSITQTGGLVLNVIEQHDNTQIWSISND